MKRYRIRRYSMSWRSMLSAALLTALVPGCSERPTTPVVKLEARRDFGYTVGGLVEHTVMIELPSGASVDPKLLPTAGPINDWLDLRAIGWSLPRSEQLQLNLSYLILKGVKAPEPTAIPPLPLSIRQGDTIRELQTPEWPFTLMPVIPPELSDEHVKIRGMAALPTASMRTSVWALVLALLGAALCGFLIALRRGVFPALSPAPPFTAALKELERLARAPNQPGCYPAGLKRIHRAIDETAGFVTFGANLSEFMDHHPGFKPLRAEFDLFFERSQRCFFSGGGSTSAVADDWGFLADFCRRCARAERGPR